MKKIIFNSIIVILFSFSVIAQNEINHTYPLTDGPDKNPMKGWNSGWWDNFDEATVGFQYLKWNEFEPTDGNFDFNYIEDVINRPGSAGKHLILRLYTDWFGNNQTSDAGPQWLYNDYNVARLQASNGKYITDYNDANYISQVTQAIQALANQYDDDPRIYSIQLGVLGYWGEWHTYSFDDANFEIEDPTMSQILTVYDNSFTNVKVMGRYPWREPLASVNTIGFHNDFFKPNDGHSDEFDNAISAGSKWLQGPVGGEIPPIDNSNQFMIDLYETTTGLNMIQTGHYSTMKVSSDERPCASDPNGQKCQGFIAMHKKMGYNFQITSALFAQNILQSNNINIELNLTNIGVAPMYYDWDVQFALLDQNNQVAALFEVPYNVTTIKADGLTYNVTTSASLAGIGLDNYNLAVRIIQPDADQTKSEPWALEARHTYALFANDLPVINGSWDSNNALVGGWSILGTVTVENSILSVDGNNVLENNVNIYPNPATETLNIVKSEAIQLQKIQLYDLTGRLIRTVNLKDMLDSKTIDITNLSTGIYTLIITSSEGEINKRFVKQ